MDIKPQIRDQRTKYRETKRGNTDIALQQRYNRIGKVRRSQQTTRQSIETIADVDGISRAYYREYKERHYEPPDFEWRAHKWYLDCRILKFCIKKPRANGRYSGYHAKFETCTQACYAQLRAPNIDNIVDQSDQCTPDKRRKRQPSLLPIKIE